MEDRKPEYLSARAIRIVYTVFGIIIAAGIIIFWAKENPAIAIVLSCLIILPIIVYEIALYRKRK